MSGLPRRVLADRRYPPAPMQPTPQRGSYRLAQLVAVLVGGSGLAQQLLWTRRMTAVVGATPSATTRVLGAFLLGLSFGAAAAAWVERRSQRPWRDLAVAQLGVGLLAVPILVLPAWSPALWSSVGSDGLAGWLGTGLRLALPLLLVAPPAACIGMTLPLLVRAALTEDRTLAREGARLYALETGGGVLGLLATAALVWAGSGETVVLRAALLASGALATLAFALDRRAARAPGRAVAQPPTPGLAVASPVALAFLSGLCVLAAEVLALHLFDQVESLALLGTASLLTAVILSLALGAAAGSWLAARHVRVTNILAHVLWLAAVTALAAPFLFVRATDGLRYLELEHSPSVALFLARSIGLALETFGPFVFVAGLVLPLTFRWFQEVADDPHGVRLGWLLAANGLGGLLGTELAGRALMPRLGMHLGFGALALLYGVAAAALAALSTRRPRRAHIALGLLVVVLGLGLVAAPRLRTLPLVRLDPWPMAKRGYRLVDLATGAEGAVAVVDFGSDRILLVDNQYVLGDTDSFLRQERMGLLPAVLHPAPRRTAFIGLGTGITAGAALLDPGVAAVTAFELSPLVAEASRRWFGPATHELASNPRGRVVIEDGRIAIEAATERYDVIVGDLVLPWQIGSGRLYTIEHFRAVRRALADGGEFCLWLPMFQLTPDEFQVIVASFLSVFPRAHLFRDDLSEDSPAFALVGFRAADLDWSVVERRTSVLRESGRTRDGFVAFPKLLRSLYLGAAEANASEKGILNTLDNDWVELDAGRQQIGGDARRLDAGAWSLLPAYLAGFRPVAK